MERIIKQKLDEIEQLQDIIKGERCVYYYVYA
jgi:hypothetical protein